MSKPQTFQAIEIVFRRDNNANQRCIIPLQTFKFFNIHLVSDPGSANVKTFIILMNEGTLTDIETEAKKLKLFFTLFYSGVSIQMGSKKTFQFETYPHLPIKQITLNDVTESDLILALDQIKQDETLHLGFSLLVNWLDTVEGKGLSGFCYFRDISFHTATDHASKEVKKEFPQVTIKKINGQYGIVRDENALALYKQKLPELLVRVRDVFLKERTNN